MLWARYRRMGEILPLFNQATNQVPEVGWGPCLPLQRFVRVLSIKRFISLNIKRIPLNFDAVTWKIGYTWCKDAAILNEMKEIDAKRRDILVKVETLKAGVTRFLLKLLQAKRNKENADDEIAASTNPICWGQSSGCRIGEGDAKVNRNLLALLNIPADECSYWEQTKMISSPLAELLLKDLVSNHTHGI